MQVDLQNINFRYPTRTDIVALDDVNIKLEPGKLVALVGLSGSGKSTLVALLQRLYDPGSGQVCLCLRAVANQDWLVYVANQTGLCMLHIKLACVCCMLDWLLYVAYQAGLCVLHIRPACVCCMQAAVLFILVLALQ